MFLIFEGSSKEREEENRVGNACFIERKAHQHLCI